MAVERIKSILLLLFVSISMFFTYRLWIGVEQYPALPEWFDEQTSIIDETYTGDPYEFLMPERMLLHSSPDEHWMVWLDNDLLQGGWNNITSVLQTSEVFTTEEYDEELWWHEVDTNPSIEFVLPEAYPLSMLGLVSKGQQIEVDPSVDRVIILRKQDHTFVYLRAVYENNYYRMVADVLEKSEVIRLLNNGVSPWVGMQKVKELDSTSRYTVARGVYVPEDVENTELLPEIRYGREATDSREWVSLFFKNVDTVRKIEGPTTTMYTYGDRIYEVAEADNEETYGKLAYSFDPGTPNSEDYGNNGPVDVLQRVDAFIATHSASDMSYHFRLTDWTITESGTWTVSLKGYPSPKGKKERGTSIPVVPFETDESVISIQLKGAQILRYERFVYKLLDVLYTVRNDDIQYTKLQWGIDRTLRQLWKPENRGFSIHPVVSSRFRGYLQEGYIVKDAYLAYRQTTSSVLTPNWVIVLAKDRDRVKFYVNALTGDLPEQANMPIAAQ